MKINKKILDKLSINYMKSDSLIKEKIIISNIQYNYHFYLNQEKYDPDTVTSSIMTLLLKKQQENDLDTSLEYQLDYNLKTKGINYIGNIPSEISSVMTILVNNKMDDLMKRLTQEAIDIDIGELKPKHKNKGRDEHHEHRHEHHEFHENKHIHHEHHEHHKHHENKQQPHDRHSKGVKITK